MFLTETRCRFSIISTKEVFRLYSKYILVHLLMSIEAHSRIDSDDGCSQHLQLFTLYVLFPSTGIPS